MKVLLICIFLFFFTNANSQAIDHTNAFRSMGSPKYVRLLYENDFFTASDEYYTQGVQLEWADPRIKNFFLSKILWQPKNLQTLNGLALETEGYTPVYIDRKDIQYGDRPFASSMLFRVFSVAMSPEKKIRLATTFTTGVMGPAAGGKAIQTNIHRWIHYTLPTGWNNQVRNDLVLNYQLNLEKNLVSFNHFRLLSDLSVRTGTYSTKLRTGVSFLIGKSPSPFELTADKKKWFYYLYNQPQVNVVGYDATLQGGLFNRSSRYTIPSKNISRITFQDRFGLVIMKGNIYLEYFQYYLTREFSTGHVHRSGGIQFGYRLRE